ncbi:hypothetical protein M5689_000385 [Euphorbia peplus]|nr:hypothetical protein M5689_000385 [Euphorbia peplus]
MSSSSLSQSVLMALTVTVNKIASSNVHSVQRKDTKKASASSVFSKRGLLFSALVAVYPTNNDSKSQLLDKYLKKSEENRAKYDKERLESYYKRNYQDYFNFVEGTVKGTAV